MAAAYITYAAVFVFSLSEIFKEIRTAAYFLLLHIIHHLLHPFLTGSLEQGISVRIEIDILRPEAVMMQEYHRCMICRNISYDMMKR